MISHLTSYGIVLNRFAHQPGCQTGFNLQRIRGFRMHDGEGIERGWAELRPLSLITKNMSSSHRTDILSEKFCHMGEKMRDKAGM